MKGIDYAFAPHPAPAAVKAAGYGFAGRYCSPDPSNDANGKNLIPAELASLHAAGLSVILFAESAAGRMKAGRPAGVADAQHALAVTAALGMDGIPVYFACDFDAAESDQPAINGYLDGAASVIGHARTGMYGGYYPLKRALDAGHAAWACQTAAWSGGQWDPRAHVRQHGTVTVGGVSCDVDEAVTADFGQWPRPVIAHPAPVVPAPGHPSGTPHEYANMSWEPVTGADHYRYQVRYADGTIKQWLTGGTHAANVPLDGRDAWRVQAGGGAWTPWMAIG